MSDHRTTETVTQLPTAERANGETEGRASAETTRHIRPPRPLTDQYRRVPLSKLAVPRAGYCVIYKDAWWFVTSADELLFYSGHRKRFGYSSPQCNQQKEVLLYMPIEGCDIRQIPFVFIPHECEQ